MTIRQRVHRPGRLRCALLIDGGHLQDCLAELDCDIDFRRLLSALPEYGMVDRAVYFCPPDSEGERSLRRLADWLTYHGYQLELPTVKAGRSRTPGIRISLVVRAMALARYVDTLTIVVGDDDYRALIAGIQQMGPRVVVLSTRRGRKVGAALRRQADDFIELSELLPQVALSKAAAVASEVVP